MPCAATWMHLEIIILSEVSQRQISYDITYMWNPKYDTNELFLQNGKRPNRHRKQTYGYQRGKWGRDKIRVWDWQI